MAQQQQDRARESLRDESEIEKLVSLPFRDSDFLFFFLSSSRGARFAVDDEYESTRGTHKAEMSIKSRSY